MGDSDKDKFANKIEPTAHALREALSAVARAKQAKYPPARQALLDALRGHITRAVHRAKGLTP